MSSGYWQIKRQTEQYGHGNTLTEKVNVYIKTWICRCYEDIPDEVPEKLSKSGRAPSYKALAMAILKNDLHLYSLGFQCDESDLVKELRLINSYKNNSQIDMFRDKK